MKDYDAPESLTGGEKCVFGSVGRTVRYPCTQHLAGMTPEDAVRKAEKKFDSPYGK